MVNNLENYSLIFDAVVFSYEVGAIKPEHQIYKVIQAHFGCDFPEMLFIEIIPFWMLKRLFP